MAALIALADRATPAHILAMIAQQFPDLRASAAAHPNARLAAAQSVSPPIPPPPPRRATPASDTPEISRPPCLPVRLSGPPLSDPPQRVLAAGSSHCRSSR